MDPRNYVRYVRGDWERQREEALREMHRRPDAEPLPDEPERPWTERVIGVALAVRGRPRRPARAAGTRRGHRPTADRPTPDPL